jgi:hypothetical protein
LIAIKPGNWPGTSLLCTTSLNTNSLKTTSLKTVIPADAGIHADYPK